METEETYTYGIPELIQQTMYENENKGHWFVSRKSLEKDYDGYCSHTQYLGSDGKWYGGMKVSVYLGGTYFKTLAEAIAVLAEFEIDVM